MTINLITTQHSVHHTQVEWDVLSRIISQFAYFERNKNSLISELYMGRIDELLSEFVRVQGYTKEFKDDYRQILSQLLSRLPADASLDKYLAYVAKEGVLNFPELNKLALMIESAQFIKKDFPALKLKEFSHLQELDHQLINRKFLKEFRYLVDDSGEVHFDKHPELAELTKRLRELEERIRRTVQDWINEPQNQKCLQYSSYDVHYDRFVVPVRSDSYRSEIGIIVSRSESGQTLFVEPYAVRDFCNRRLELIAKIDEIINQLAMKFSHALTEFSPFMLDIQYQLIKIDHYVSKADFCTQYSLECPGLKAQPGFKFTGLFHPLLKNAVKNSADCAPSNHGIVISGPNTGGKTVFLKSLAISYLLFYHGFFVPAAEAEMYPYEGLFYFGNDLQDLKAGLSSFSGEVQNYIELIENILPSNLILIDEIFNSTSSDEASALSLAYFDELHKKATCHLVVSTHHQMFKTLIHQDRSYLSCHVGFDTKNMKPTYKVQWGTPGSSMAIDIFRILAQGHDTVSEVPNRAISHLSAKNVSYETLLQRVSQKQIELDQLLNSNRQHEIELKNQKGAMEGVLNLKLQEELSRARKEIDKIMNEARELVEEARRSEITKHRKVDEKSHQLKAQVDKLGGIIQKPDEPFKPGNLNIQDVKQGDIVHSNILKKDFTVHAIDLRKSEVTIGRGPIKLTVPIFTLSSTKQGQHRPHVTVSYQKTSNAQFEIDARGMRLSEFQNKVDGALGDLLSGDVPFLNIIHGHGDGILKNWLRDYIKRSKDFHGEIPENGNDGETKVTLK
ncbi:MAG TPA: Smr/MutS family protein [Bacteriovoracaceae bacterium]|nr:Smr/MutS family protein [Bacteriovoracaceae bacterium]